MSKTILVVDDEPDVVTYLSTVLRDAGYATLEAANGEEAMEQIRKGRPDLITLDITMPEMTGVKTYRQLKADEALRKIPVIIVTGVTHDFKQFISSRAQVPAPEGYLEKPVKPEDLLAEVGRLVGDPAAAAVSPS
jgi:CheY-like chemotaxis protein